MEPSWLFWLQKTLAQLHFNVLKLNGFKTTKPKNGYTANYLKTKGNPNEFLGQRIDLTPEKIQEIAKKFKEHGATIIGGCCETRPSHIEAMAKIK